MTVFWVVAALFLAGALLMLLPPLLRPAGSDAATAPPARALAGVLALALPLGSIAIYLRQGHPPTSPSPTAPVAGATDRHALTPDRIEQMATALTERLRADPGDAEGWRVLGRSYTALGRYRDAAGALRRANDLQPGDATLLADLADLVGMTQNKRLAGEPARLIQQALDIDPRHAKALSLAGSVAFEAHDYAAARAYWERLAALVPAGTPLARSVQVNIAQATQLDSPASGAAAGTTLQGEVVLSPALAARVGPGDTLFVFARATEGPRMPLAIVRRPAASLPFAFTLDDSMAMAPNLRLSGFARVTVGARLSKSGNATPQAGDLVGQSAPVAPGARGLRIVIDREQP